VEIAVQINGKVRGRIRVPAEAGEEEVREILLSQERFRELLKGKEIKKLIYVKGRLVNLVVG